MISETRRLDAEGFTLIEVMVAMVILAVGLLGLEALGIGAARAIALADRQSGYATLASDSLEAAMHQVRRGNAPARFCIEELPFGDRMSREVVVTPQTPPPGEGQLIEVVVRIIPNPESFNSPAEEFRLEGSRYLPFEYAVPGVPAGASCG